MTRFSVLSLKVFNLPVAALWLAVAATVNMTAHAASSQASREAVEEDVRLDTPSGYPVPRFVSLKSEKTFCRVGPTFAHPVRLTYQRRGLPVMVVAETRDHWRKIRDFDGDECWMHRTKLSGAQTVIVVEEGLVLRARPNDGAMQKARLGRGLVARVESVRDGWVKVSAGDVKSGVRASIRGWAPQSGLWGAPASAASN